MLCFLPSPVGSATLWHPVASLLAAGGWPVAEASLPDDAPVSADAVLGAFLGSLPADRDIVLIPHSNSGRYVPAITNRRRVAGYVFVDAVLPPPAGEMPMVSAEFCDFLAAKADADGLLPPWSQWWDPADVAPLFPSADARAEFERNEPRLPLAYFRQTCTVPAGWDAKPGGYLGFGEVAYATEIAAARARGWPVRVIPGGHLHMLTEPAQVAAEIEDLLGVMLR